MIVIFDQPALWRAEIIKDFRLRGAERCAAASPAPGFPRLFDSLLGAVAGHGDRWLDVGGGLGGTASWVERNSTATVIVVDPAEHSVVAARQLFPTLVVSVGGGTQLPVADSTIDVVMLNGVASLLGDVGALATEARRVLVPAGHVLVADIWSATAQSFEVGPNRFHAIESFVGAWAQLGFALTHLAVADTSTGWWSAAATQVNDEIIARHAGDDGFAEWYDDLRHLDEVLNTSDLMAAGLVLRAIHAGHDIGDDIIEDVQNPALGTTAS